MGIDRKLAQFRETPTLNGITYLDMIILLSQKLGNTRWQFQTPDEWFLYKISGELPTVSIPGVAEYLRESEHSPARDASDEQVRSYFNVLESIGFIFDNDEWDIEASMQADIRGYREYAVKGHPFVMEQMKLATQNVKSSALPLELFTEFEDYEPRVEQE